MESGPFSSFSATVLRRENSIWKNCREKTALFSSPSSMTWPLRREEKVLSKRCRSRWTKCGMFCWSAGEVVLHLAVPDAVDGTKAGDVQAPVLVAGHVAVQAASLADLVLQLARGSDGASR